MRPEFETIRQALLSRNALDGEAGEALDSLEAAFARLEGHPAGSQVREVVEGTASNLAEEGNEDGTLAATWDDLKDQLSHLEDEYPGLVLAIGRVSNSLATLGL